MAAELERKRLEAVAEAARRAKLSVEERLADDARNARKHIVEKILNLACPRCAQVFDNFTGCYSLSCSRCPCKFCAYCLADCGGDAHSHVTTCTHRVDGDSTYHGAGGAAAGSSFERAQRARRQRMVKEHLSTLSGSVRAITVRICTKDFADLKLDIRD